MTGQEVTGGVPRGLRPALIGVLSSVLFLLAALAGLPGANAQLSPATPLGTATQLSATPLSATQLTAVVQLSAAVAAQAGGVTRSSRAPRFSTAGTRQTSLGERRTPSSTLLTQQRPSLGGASGPSPPFADLAVPSWSGLVRPSVQAVTSTSSSLAGTTPSSQQSRAPPAQAVRV